MYFGFFIGIALGVLLQRGQFCFVSGFRRIYTQRNFRFLTALFLAISIQSIGFFSLEALGVISLPTSQLPLIATLLGGFLFGFGMMLSNCCGSGAWFRTGEGALGSLIALIFFALTMASTQTGVLKHWVNPLLESPVEIDNIHLTLGISPWILVALVVLITAGLFYYQAKNPRYQPPAETTQAVVFPRLFAKHWNIYVTATLIGLLGVLAWVLSSETGRNFGFGISVPSANVVQYWVTGQQRYLNWGTLFVLGILLGSLISAKLSGELAWRLPEPKAILQRIAGGILMGIGAALAGGCTITNSLVATAYFSWQGWLATFTILLGCYVATKCVPPTQCRI